MKEQVLITGITGWIAQFCAAELLRRGYKVRGSIRHLGRRQEVENALEEFIQEEGQLSFCELDLLKDEGWDQAAEGCQYVMHVASPFVMVQPKNEDDLIRPAKEGTLRALKAAQKAGVKRVVVTSSIAAMFSHLREGGFSEETWTDLESKYPNAYQKSKTVAERAAWDFYKNQSGAHKIELAVVNPGAVLGPALSADLDGVSLGFGAAMLRGEMPGIPNVNIVMVDVRDVAAHHFHAMVHPEADGKRFISAHEEPDSFFRVAEILRSKGFDKAPAKKVPTLMLRVIALFDPEARGMLGFVDTHVSCDNSLTKKMFGWTPIPLEKTVSDMGQSIQKIIDKAA